MLGHVSGTESPDWVNQRALCQPDQNAVDSVLSNAHLWAFALGDESGGMYRVFVISSTGPLCHVELFATPNKERRDAFCREFRVRLQTARALLGLGR